VGATSRRELLAAGASAVAGLALGPFELRELAGGANLELRWDGVPSLAEGMRLLKAQVARTPPGQWVRVVGGFGELQLAEKRLPRGEARS
jgi:hypothetical protein